MKRVFSTLVALVCSAVVYGSQSGELVMPVGASLNGSVVDISVIPPSAIEVRLNIECESIEAGELARYAQKYLGTPANLLSKSVYSISSAVVAKSSADHYIAADEFVTDSKSVTFESEDIKLPVNITSAKVLNPEESAQKAAEEIFYIRNTRREILAGEFGEGFYGGGLGAALDQFRRDEEAYSKLFFGSVSTERGSKLFTVPLSGETKRYVVCRFSVQSGVMPSNDLSAEPVTLQITPLDPVEVNVPMGDEKSVFKNFMVATWVRVDLIFDGETIATQTMPLYEFGQKVSYPVSPVKK